MEKKPYNQPEMALIEFLSEDVIITSGLTGEWAELNQGEQS